MSLQKSYPFRRVSVDHMIRGVTRVWWQLEPTFAEAGPYTFQIQRSDTGLPNAENWKDVGPPVVNTVYAVDEKQRDAGDLIVTHYRVTLSTPTGKYISAPASCFGELDESDWLRAREIIRKEMLRHQKVSVGGYLIKVFRYGKPCGRCRDQLTQEPSDSYCPVCFGTNYEGGYHPALALQCWDLSPQVIQENSDDQLKGSTRENPYITARVIGFPGINYKDVWVNGSTDERWRIDQIQVAAAIRGVPLIYEARMGLLPFTHVAYKLPLTDEPLEAPTLPIIGTGCISVNSTYNGNDLRYLTAEQTAVAGANVYAFEKALFDSADPQYPPRHYAVAGTITGADGNWTTNMLLNPGQYVLLYEKENTFGPDEKELTVVRPVGVEPHPPTTPLRKVDSFWDI